MRTSPAAECRTASAKAGGMVSRFLLVIACFAAPFLTGCATITTGTDQRVEILTDPEGAACSFTRNGESIGEVNPTPGHLTVSKANADILVNCSKEGYFENAGKVGSKFQAMTFGNILFGGLIGVIIDVASGATTEYEPRIKITMVPTGFPSIADRDSFFDRLKRVLSEESKEVRDRIQAQCGAAPQCGQQLALADEEEKKANAQLESQRERALIRPTTPSRAIVAPVPDGPRTPEADRALAKVSPSVWIVRGLDAQERPVSTGSAVVVGPGRLITACHVLRNARAIQVRQDDVAYAATLEFPDVERDLCQISTRSLRAPAVPIAPASAAEPGQRVFAVGNARGTEIAVSEGVISSARGDAGTQVILHSAPLGPGSSGGGLFDRDGRLVGITTAQSRDARSLYAAIPAGWIAEIPARGQAALDRRREAAEAAPVPPPAPVSEFPRDITGEAFTKFFQANRTLNGVSADGRPLRFQLFSTYIDGFTEPNSMNPGTAGGITASARGALQMPAGTSQICLNFNTSLNTFWVGQSGCYRLVQMSLTQYRLQPVKDGTDFTFSAR